MKIIESIKVLINNKRNELIFLGICLAIPFFILLPSINKFPFPLNSRYSDFLITHYPNFIYIQNSITNFQQVPLWSDSIFSGYPFAADPLSSLFYPPSWFCWVLPLPFCLNMLTLFHILLGAVGIYIFLRAEGFQLFPALAGTLVFELLPKVYGHFGAGHITLLWAYSLTPWLFYLDNLKYYGKRSGWSFWLTGMLWSLIILADVRWAIYSLIFWILFSLYKNFQINTWINVYRFINTWIFTTTAQILTGLFMAAPLLLPLFQYTMLSTRSFLKPEDNLAYSLPLLKLINLLLPDFGSFAEWTIYPGMVGLVLLLIIIVRKETRKKYRFWIVGIVVSLIISLGSNIPYISIISGIPLINLLRVPTRVLFITGICFAFITAGGLTEITSRFGLFEKPDKIIPLLLIGFSAIVVALGMGLIIVTRSVNLELSWGPIFAILFSLLTYYRVKNKDVKQWWMIIYLLCIILDSGWVSYTHFRFENSYTNKSNFQEIMDSIKNSDEYFRVYTPSNTIQQQEAAVQQLELVNGINPLQLKSYVEFMKKATGVNQSGYSVTIPAFSSGNPDTDNSNLIPETDQLGLLNTRYIISGFEIAGGGLKLLKKVNSIYIYDNPRVKPRVWIQNTSATIGEEIISAPNIIITPNRIDLETQSGGLLVLSEINYPGWKAYMDGKAVDIVTVSGLLRGLNVPEGYHKIIFTYQPTLMFIGMAISLITYIFFFLDIKYRRYNK